MRDDERTAMMQEAHEREQRAQQIIDVVALVLCPVVLLFRLAYALAPLLMLGAILTKLLGWW